jgi:hypothetical protein
MASQAPTRTREEERRLSLRTLAIASVASAVAALVTSHFSTAGTPIAAALTPVIVTLVSELLHRPTEKIAERMTGDREAILPDAAGAAPPPPPSADPLPPRAPAEPKPPRGGEEETERPVETEGLPETAPWVSEPDAGEAPTRARTAAGTGPPGPRDGGGSAPVRVYRGRPARRRRIAIGVVVATGLLAFAIAAVLLTVPELLTGQSIGRADRDTTLFGGRSKQPGTETSPTQTTPQKDEQQQRDQQPKQRQDQPKEQPRPKGGQTQPPADQGGGAQPPGAQSTPTAPEQPQP